MSPEARTDGDVPTPSERLAEQLRDHPHVESAEVNDARHPPAINVRLNTTAISRGVEEVLDANDATLIDASVAEDGEALTISVRRDDPLRDAGKNTLRSHGTSIVITFPREALDLSGFEEGDELDIDARGGEIRLTERRR